MLGFSPLATNPLAAHGLYVDITPSGGAVFGGGASYKVIFARAASGNIIVSNNNLRLLQSWASTTVTSGTGSVTWGQARTPGSLLVLAISSENAPLTTPTGWNLDKTDSASVNAYLFYRISDNTATDSPSFTSFAGCLAWAEYVGNFAYPEDVDASNTSIGLQFSTGTTAVTAQANEIAIAVWTGIHIAGTLHTWTVSTSGYTERVDTVVVSASSGDSFSLCVADNLLSSIGTQSAAATSSGFGVTRCALIGTYKGSGIATRFSLPFTPSGNAVFGGGASYKLVETYLPSGNIVLGDTSPSVFDLTIEANGNAVFGSTSTTRPTYNLETSGNAILGDTAPPVFTLTFEASAGLVLAGESDYSFTPNQPYYDYEASGNAVLAGDASEQLNLTYLSSGGMVCGSTSDVYLTLLALATGNAVFSGTTGTSQSFDYSASGNVVLAGDASEKPIYTYLSSGNMVLANSADVTVTIGFAASAGLVLAGESDYSFTPNQANYDYEASGNVVLAGDASEQLILTYLPSGNMTCGSTSNVYYLLSASATGNAVFSGTAIASHDFDYSASGNVVLAGDASEQLVLTYLPSGNMTCGSTSDIYFALSASATGNAVFGGTIVASHNFEYEASGNAVLAGTTQTSYVNLYEASGNAQLGSSFLTDFVFYYVSSGGMRLDGGAIYETTGGASFGGSADVQIFRVADMPTGGLRLDLSTIDYGRYYAHAAEGGLQTSVESGVRFYNIIPYFLSIEDTLTQDRQDLCSGGVGISKSAVIGLLQGTATILLLDKADHWEIDCYNNPELGDIRISIYKDGQNTRIVWNLFRPFYPTVHVEIPKLPIIETDFKQYSLPIQYPDDVALIPNETIEETPNIAYTPILADGKHQGKLDIYYPGDTPVGYESEPEETPNIAVMPTIRTEVTIAAPVLRKISQSSLISLVGPYHFLNKLTRSQWRVLEFNNRKATVELNGKNIISVSV